MHTLPKYLTQDEFPYFVAAMTPPRDEVLFGLIYHDGLWVGQAVM